jgi:hypothetical protein
MTIYIVECHHCGTEYKYQGSGSYEALDTPRALQDAKYCSDCKKAINDALSIISKKFEYRYVHTNEVTLDTLILWDQLNREDMINKFLFPQIMRVFPTCSLNGEYQIAREVIGRDEFKGRYYYYSYWPSDKDNPIIKVEKRINLLTNEPVGYRLKK